MHGRRRYTEEPLHVQLSWSLAVDQRVVVNECKVLSLLRCVERDAGEHDGLSDR